MCQDLKPNEHIELISDRLQLIVSPEHTFGTDALLLAAFASPRPGDKACDFGTGCGIIPFYWLARGLRSAAAVELQETAADQLSRAVRRSGVGDRLTLIRGDLRDLRTVLPAGAFDLITMNPPYTKTGHGIESSAAADKLARHETAATLEEICAAAAFHLKFGGRFCICLRPERLTDAFAAMRAAGIEPKRLRFVAKNAESAPWLFLLEGKRGRRPGLTVEKTLCIQTTDGAPSPEMTEIAAPYRKE